MVASPDVFHGLFKNSRINSKNNLRITISYACELETRTCAHFFLYRNQEVSFEAGCSKVVLRVVFFRKAVQKTSPNLQEFKEFTYTRVVFNKFVGCMRIFFIKSVTYPEIFGGYRLCPKSVVFFFFLSCESPK